MDLWLEIRETQELLDKSLIVAKDRGRDWAEAERNYQSIKSRTAYELLEAGRPVTFISLVIKGEPMVNEAMGLRDRRLVEYENAKEARNVLKKKLDTLREQYAREWSQSGMRD